MILASLYSAITTLSNHSSIYDFPVAHLITFHGTLSNAFSMSKTARYSYLFLARCFSCS